jgi:hypothetical protein
MSNQQPKKKTPRSSPKKPPSKTSSTAELALEQVMGLIAPLTEFHKDVDSAVDTDLRIYWDVRVVQGRGKTFAHSQGSSSLPGALTPKMKAHAPSMIQQEVVDKIAQPLVAAFQTEGEEQNEPQMQKLADMSMHNPALPAPNTGGDGVLAIASGDAGADPDDPGYPANGEEKEGGPGGS